jgi:MFS superfamily sulfate permease-like transporter
LPFSFLSWLKGYDRSWLRFDIIAALTTWALIVPQSIAYGQIAGLPPQAGLFTAFGSLLGYALLGTSRQLIVSPASATAAVSASLIAPLALGDAARYWSLSSLLAIIVGITFVVYGLLKLGFVSQFIATAVQTGLMFGLGLTIIAGQLPKLLGIPTADGTFIQECLNIVRHIGATHWATLALGATCLIALLVGKRVTPKLPMPLIVVIVSILIVTLLGLTSRGVEVIGDVGTQIPIPKLPDFGLKDLGALVPGAIALSLIGYAESDTVAGKLQDSNDYANVAGAQGAQAIPGLLILRLDAPLIAFNAQSARSLIRERVGAAQPKPRVVLFDLEMSPDLDVGSIDKLAQIDRELNEDGVQLWLARPHGEAVRMLHHSGLVDLIGPDRVFQTVGQGVAAYATRAPTEKGDLTNDAADRPVQQSNMLDGN